VADDFEIIGHFFGETSAYPFHYSSFYRLIADSSHIEKYDISSGYLELF